MPAGIQSERVQPQGRGEQQHGGRAGDTTRRVADSGGVIAFVGSLKAGDGKTGSGRASNIESFELPLTRRRRDAGERDAQRHAGAGRNRLIGGWADDVWGHIQLVVQMRDALRAIHTINNDVISDPVERVERNDVAALVSVMIVAGNRDQVCVGDRFARRHGINRQHSVIIAAVCVEVQQAVGRRDVRVPLGSAARNAAVVRFVRVLGAAVGAEYLRAGVAGGEAAGMFSDGRRPHRSLLQSRRGSLGGPGQAGYFGKLVDRRHVHQPSVGAVDLHIGRFADGFLAGQQILDTHGVAAHFRGLQIQNLEGVLRRARDGLAIQIPLVSDRIDALNADGQSQIVSRKTDGHRRDDV